jgi:predicted HTH transcriptional regulator
VTKDHFTKRARLAQRESKYLDFKADFDVSDKGAWAELIKDVVAMANTGGGVIVFGVNDNGTPARFDPTELLTFDPANITDKLAKYTGREFGDFDVHEVKRGRTKTAALFVQASLLPLVFREAGTYQSSTTGAQKIAFQKGTIYFRHGAKSQPANENDSRRDRP